MTSLITTNHDNETIFFQFSKTALEARQPDIVAVLSGHHTIISGQKKLLSGHRSAIS